MPWLNAADNVNGIIFTIAIDKETLLTPVYNTDEGITIHKRLEELEVDNRIGEKLFRIALFGSFILGGLVKPGQSIIWAMDSDNIVQNQDRVEKALFVINMCLDSFCPHDLRGGISINVSKRDRNEAELLTEDLTSIPDLVAGFFTEAIATRVWSASSTGERRDPLQFILSRKAQAIGHWFGNQHRSLKRLTCMIHKPDNGKVRINFADIRSFPPVYETRFPVIMPECMIE
jgi:hypothetical protein